MRRTQLARTAALKTTTTITRRPRPTLITTFGPPASGKTTLRHKFLRHHPDIPVASLDDNRRALSWCGCDMNQDVTPLAVELAISTTRTALAAGRTVFWDATNTERASRMMLPTEFQIRQYPAVTS